MIPKILHYCWFGHGAMDPVSKRCLESWKKFCPDYKIVLWSEDNFDIHQNVFVEEAYAQKKWAFVTDYVRLYVLYNYGGIYLDADVELLKNLDDLLDLGDVVTGYQECTIPAAIMMANAKNPWIGRMLSYYDNRHFIQEDGTLDIMENDKIMTVLSAREFGFKIGDSHIEPGNVCLLDSVYFGPYKRVRHLTQKGKDIYDIDPQKTYTIHHGIGSWDPRTGTAVGWIKFFVLGIVRFFLPEKVYVKIKGRFMLKKLGLK